MTGPTPRPRPWDRPSPRRFLLAVIGLGFGLRVVAAFGVQAYVDRVVPPRLCVFPDTDIYWSLAGTIRAGEPYQVSQWGVPHLAIRTPGYPIFLAACRALFGDRLLPVRLVQAALGAASAWLAHGLVRRIVSEGAAKPEHPASLLAAALVAFEPYTVALSALVLSEALFVPLMLAMLWGMAIVWTSPRPAPAIATGLLAGAAILIRPSWAIVLPPMVVAWLASVDRVQRWPAARGALLVMLGLVVAMAPWWVRNARALGRFVPTALWVGPSLYDGLNPGATGASDMAFLEDPDIRRLDEPTQDAVLRGRALAFARSEPGRVLALALAKSARYWSPWPNAESLSSPIAAGASALVVLPTYALILLGASDRRRDARALALLAGPILAFWALHALFVGSIRYRIPGEVPALGLAAIGLARALEHRKTRGNFKV